MWPNTWKSHLVKKTEPSTTQYKAQKSTQKLFLTDVKKGILEKNSTIELTTTTKRISRDIVHDLINATTTYSQQTEQYSQFEVAQAFEITEDYSIAKLQMIKSAEASKRARIAFSTHKSNGKKDQISESLNNVSAGLYPIQQANLVASKSQPKSAPSKAKAFSRSGKSLSAATVETLIDILVNGADYRFISDFFISYRLFMSPVQLCKSLVSKFLDSLRAELVKSRKIRIQIHLIIKYWLKEYFTYDFASSVTLSFTLKNFLKSMLNHPQIIKFSEDIKLIFSLYELYQCKKLTSADSIQSTLRSLTSLSEHVDQGNDHSKQLGHKTSFDSIVSSTSECTAKSNLYRNKLALLNLPIEPPDDASLNQWTMRMACSLANSKSRIPEIYNSIIFGTSQPTDRRQNMRTSRSSSTSNGYIVDMEVPGSPVTSSPNDRNGNSRHKRSFLFSYSTETIAQQFCIIEQRCLCAVEWHELVEVRWKPDSGKDSHEKCSGVLSQIDRFNIMCQWVATEIVTCDHIEERARIIEKLVRIAMRCYQHRNYSTLLQILLGLQSSNVSRLSRTWERVGMQEKRMLDELKEFTSPCKNWTNIRGAMRKASEDYRDLMWSDPERQDCKMVGEACIPFFGLFLSDLTYNSELPAYLPPSSEDSAKLVNFHKHRITASVIKRLLSFQTLSKRYPFRPDVSVFPKCLFLKYVDEAEIRQLSLRCE